MMVSLSNFMLCPKQQMSVAATACPVFLCRPNYNEVIRWLNRGKQFPVCLANGFSKRRVYGAAANYEGLWEDPDDGSDDSEYEDESDDEDEEENDLDYESDWEASGNEKAVVGNVDKLSMRKYEENLVREVEQLLGPEERAILEQNEAPNLEKLSTAKWKPLHTFALAGQIKFMDGLLEQGYDINLVHKDGLTALHLAVIGKREAVISHLLRKGANPEVKDQDGATPLHYAAQVGALQTVKLLIKYKVDVNVADNEGWTPLHVAMQTRNRDIAKILLVNGADRTRRNQVPKLLPFIRQENFILLRVDCSEVLLLSCYLNLLQDGNTPLDLSLCYGKDFKSYELAKLLKQVPATRGF
ncbi:Ankyrin repeat domain-containing protein, chloroplastic [Sesamum angolense]|uniref:Ankyrin repeat domain-containing protein, chloroplastic n=1 Tax=Sesamum angolense TaxID=2727404 RepID=A0AAE2C5M8_9LAMI|nr:Ankyrin repeat domain-containing protein, chloroplastic [Sesamum angolense]